MSEKKDESVTSKTSRTSLNSLHSPVSGCAQEQTLLYLSGRLGKKITFCAIKSLMLNGSCSNF